MPKDEWRKANLRAEYGPVRTRRKQKTTRRKAKGKQHCRLQGLTDPNARLWFGKYKGKRLTEVPADYLIWLCKLEAKSDRLKVLQKTIRKAVTQNNSRRKRSTRC